MIIAKITKELIYNSLLFDEPVRYVYFDKEIVLYPIKMKSFLDFRQCKISIILRKDSIFQEKKIIKMNYLEFVKYACRNQELALKYKMPLLPIYYDLVIKLFKLACGKDAVIKYNKNNLDFYINDVLITSEIFEDLRRIIILQNDIDYDIDEFINKDTLEALEEAKIFETEKNKEKAEIEDYIDSLAVALKVSCEYIKNMTIRKFWRYIKRINIYDDYKICKTAEYSGMVTFKEPIKSWMTTIEVKDKYENVKADENELRSKIG